MEMKVSASGDTVTIDIPKRMNYISNGTIRFSYGVDVSQTPRHALNFMAGMIFAEHFAWNSQTPVFDELTPDGKACIDDHIRMESVTNMFNRVAKKPARSCIAKRLVNRTLPNDNGVVLCANGMGKDGLVLANMVHETGLPLRCFTVTGHMKNERLWKERWGTTKRFYKSKRMKYDLVDTNYHNLVQWKVLPRWVMALPLAYHFGASAILIGLNFPMNKTFSKQNLPYRLGTSIFSLQRITEACGITINSPTFAITLYGAQKILIERYEDSMKYQRSCMHGFPWCGKCGKCAKLYNAIRCMGYNPIKYGLKRSPLPKWKGKNVNEINTSELRYIAEKSQGKARKQDHWVEKTSKPVLGLMWRADLFAPILTEHCPIFEKDPGVTMRKMKLLPSQWKKWMNEESDIFWHRKS